MVGFKLTLGQEYWSKGFFNVPVDFERFLSHEDGPIDLYLGTATEPTPGRMSRSANRNATPRVFGSRPLREFFQTRFKRGDVVLIELVSPHSIRIGAPEANATTVNHQKAPPAHGAPVPREVERVESSSGVSVAQPLSVGDLADLKRKLVLLLNSFDRQRSTQSEGIRKRIGRLSQTGGPIPRAIAALMVTITEMRNSAEHELKVLSMSESAAVRHAWQAIEEWAQSARR